MGVSSCSYHSVRTRFALSALLALSVSTVLLAPPALAQATRVIFLHHSTGESLIEEGDVREGLTALGHEFFDHGYNDDGLRLADGSYTGTHFDVPGDNTDPDGFAEIFAQPLHDPPDNAFSHLMQYDVIAFKSCFPASNIGDDAQLAQYRSYYLSIRDRVDQYPGKLFIVLTPPPQVPNNSDAEEATRARAFANWLKSEEYRAGRSNVFVFDFFDILAGPDSFLRPEYRVDEYDGHPNERANREIGPVFVDFIDQAIGAFRTEGPPPQVAEPTPSEQGAAPPSDPPQETTEPPDPVTSPASSMIQDFESGSGGWEADAGGEGSSLECAPDGGAYHSGTSSLLFQYALGSDGWGYCGRSFEELRDWSGSNGLSIWIHSDEPGQRLVLMMFAGELDAAAPYEAAFETSSGNADGWAEHTFPWEDFVLAAWADEGGPSELDPSRVVGLGFSFGEEGVASDGNLRVDDIRLSAERAGTEPAPVATAIPAPESDEPVEEDTLSGGGSGACCGATMTLPLAALLMPLMRRNRKNTPPG